MAKIELLHNDDEVLDPSDSTLRRRGSLRVDGHARGSWEEHLDGHYVARLGERTINAPDRSALIAQIERSLVG